MIHVVDKASIGSLHVMYNASILKVIRKVFPDEAVTFYAEKEHLGYVQSEVLEESIVYTPISIISSKTTNPVQWIWQLIKKIADDRRFFKELLIHCSANKEDKIFLCTAATLSFLAFKKLKKSYSTPVIATVHGELEHIYFAHDKREKSIGNIYKKIFKIKASNFYYLVLNKISKKQLVADGYVKEAEVIEIDHPYIYNTLQSNRKNREHVEVLKIGHVGSLGARKSAHLIYALADELKELIKQKKLIVHSIGLIETNVIQYRNKWVEDGFETNSDSSKHLSREEFERKVEELDYALFFYNQEQFIYRASGAIFDVITYEKPIIVLKHPYFDYLFEKGGNIGYICDNLDEMANLISKLAQNNSKFSEEYKIQCKNINLLKNKMSIKEISMDMINQINKIKYYKDEN